MLGNWSPISLWQRWLRFGLFWICNCFNVAVGRKSGREIELFVRFRSQIWQIYLRYCLFFVEKERKKERYEEDKVKEVTLTEWMRLAKPQSNWNSGLHWTTISSHASLININVGYVRNLGPLISYLCSATFTENWTRPDLQIVQWSCRKEVWQRLHLGAVPN